MLNEISYVNLFRKNNKEAIKFYRDTLGIKAFPNQDEERKWYGFETSPVTLAIEAERNKFDDSLGIDRTGQQVLIQFKADSIEHLEEINEFLENQGVELLRKSYKKEYGYCTNFLDPEGNLLEVLYEEQNGKI